MSCGCKGRKRETYRVKLAGGLTVTKTTEDEATRFAAKHPGATVTKVPARS